MKNRQIVTLLLCLLTSPVFAQKGEDDNGPVGVFESRQAYYDFMGGVKDVAYGEGGNAELRAMVPMLNDLALNQPIGTTAGEYNTEGTTLGLLSDKAVRADLEMLDDQYENLKQRNSEIQDRIGQQIRNLDLSDRDNLIDRIRDIRSQAENELDSVLLPHQVARLRQIRVQAKLRRQSLVDLLTSDPLKTVLEISEKQSEELREAEVEIAKDLEREIAKLREKARNRLLSELKPNQKAEVQELLGDTFDFTSSKPAQERQKKRWKKGK